MRLERSREYTINMGNNTYESVRIGSTAVVEWDDNVPDARQTAIDLADELLNAALVKEVNYYSDLTLKRDSFIHTVKKDLADGKSTN